MTLKHRRNLPFPYAPTKAYREPSRGNAKHILRKVLVGRPVRLQTGGVASQTNSEHFHNNGLILRLILGSTPWFVFQEHLAATNLTTGSRPIFCNPCLCRFLLLHRSVSKVRDFISCSIKMSPSISRSFVIIWFKSKTATHNIIG